MAIDKKYQVFISSTYEDLKDERRAVEQTIIRGGDFPVGMEAFPAADEEQFEFIKTVIDQCDYYVLIIAGRYGSVSSDGKSYTEKEYEYAIEIGVPVLVMLHENRGDLSSSKTDPENRERLDRFIQSASTGRLRKGWSTLDGLKLAVREALDHAKATKQRPGWVRGNHTASTETLEKIIFLQQENEKLRDKLKKASPAVVPPENLAGLETAIKLSGHYKFLHRGGLINQGFEVETSFMEIFELLSPHLMKAKVDSAVPGIIGECVWNKKNKNTGEYSFTIKDETFQTIKIQLMALNMVKVAVSKTVAGGAALFWELTEAGKQEMVLRRVITKS